MQSLLHEDAHNLICMLISAPGPKAPKRCCMRHRWLVAACRRPSVYVFRSRHSRPTILNVAMSIQNKLTRRVVVRSHFACLYFSLHAVGFNRAFFFTENVIMAIAKTIEISSHLHHHHHLLHHACFLALSRCWRPMTPIFTEETSISMSDSERVAGKSK